MWPLIRGGKLGHLDLYYSHAEFHDLGKKKQPQLQKAEEQHNFKLQTLAALENMQTVPKLLVGH